MTTEDAIAALLTYLQNTLYGTFPTIGRRLVDWTKVAEQPALFIRHETDSDQWQGVGLVRSSVSLKLWIYAKTGPDDVPDTILNNLIRTIADSFAPDPPANQMNGWFTLGGKVFWCRIEGETELYPGDIANQAIAILPVNILLP